MTIYFEGGPLNGQADDWLGPLPPEYRLTSRQQNVGGNALYTVAVYVPPIRDLLRHRL